MFSIYVATIVKHSSVYQLSAVYYNLYCNKRNYGFMEFIICLIGIHIPWRYSNIVVGDCF